MVRDSQAMQASSGSEREKHLPLLAVNSAASRLFIGSLAHQCEAVNFTSAPPSPMLGCKLVSCSAHHARHRLRYSGSLLMFTISRIFHL